MLFPRERDADDVGTAVLGDVGRHRAPTGADVENAVAGPDVQLGGDVAQLGDLGFLQRRVGIAEIGAGVVEALVEKEPVHLVRKVVVYLDIPAGAALAVGGREAA